MINIKGNIRAENLSVIYRGEREVKAIKELGFKINAGEFITFLGTSGCGKSTILNVIAGFIKPTTGKVLLDDKEINCPSSSIGIVFQHNALFPWKNVEKNIGFGLKLQKMDKSERISTINKYLKIVGLSGINKVYPDDLSGGMQQRIAVARALANDPTVLLMDEPFGAIDAQTRILMQELLIDIQRKLHKTIVFVTHDVDEAVLLSDRIFVLTASPGEIKEEIIVSFDKESSYDKIVTSDEFIEIKRKALSLIREETNKTFS